MPKDNIEELIKKRSGNFSVLIQDLSSQTPVCDINSDRSFVSASVIKTPIMLCLLNQVGKGQRSLSDELLISEVLDDSLTFKKPRSATLHELVTWMIIDSDNTSTNALIRLLGFDQINAYIQELGLAHTSLQRLMLDFDAIKQGKNNYIQNRDLFILFKKLFTRSILTPPLCDLAIGILLKQRDTKCLPRLIWEDGVSFAHKTGGLDYLRHDTGVMILNSKSIFIGVLSDNCDAIEGYPDLIGEIGRIAFDFFI
ncbi:MAG: class A beta-lactamase-related serine hydrolase [Clostridiales bacterium]|jgi:beta-lactamase class A|nr:class A beta-lactamase-related serine hydrolase [Clostridiales bacterium]